VNWLLLLFFTGFIALHASLYWHSVALIPRYSLFYFILQGIIIYAASFLIYIGSPIVLIGLYPVLLGQSFAMLNEKRKITIGLIAAAYLILTIIALLATDWL